MNTVFKKITLPLMALVVGIIGARAQQADQECPPERTYTYQQRELEYLMEIWPGKYDNVEQLDFDKALKKTSPETGAHARWHSIVERVELPDFGDHVLYVEEYKDDDPNTLARQCIYTLQADEEAQAIRIQVHHFKKRKPYRSLKQKVPVLEGLKPGSVVLEAGCDLLLQREGMAFRAKTENKDCIPHPTNSEWTIDYQIRIAENDYWFQEINYNKLTKVRLPDAQQNDPYQLEKARCFVCMVDFPNQENGRPTITEHYIKIDDQGGKFEFDYPDGRHMVLGMRNTWSFGMQRETFVIFIQEDSQKGPTLIYSWGEPGADRIGFNPGWIRVQCDLDTPKNIKLQHGLRPGS